MAGSFSNSWSLVKASANVLKLDKELLVFPILSGVATILVTLSFIVPMAWTGGWQMFAGESGSYLGTVVGFLFYMVQYLRILWGPIYVCVYFVSLKSKQRRYVSIKPQKLVYIFWAQDHTMRPGPSLPS